MLKAVRAMAETPFVRHGVLPAADKSIGARSVPSGRSQGPGSALRPCVALRSLRPLRAFPSSKCFQAGLRAFAAIGRETGMKRYISVQSEALADALPSLSCGCPFGKAIKILRSLNRFYQS